jgi:hypothetical protein
MRTRSLQNIDDAVEVDNLVSSYQHIYPLFDGREHICVGFTCWCKPLPDVENSNVIIHNPQLH